MGVQTQVGLGDGTDSCRGGGTGLGRVIINKKYCNSGYMQDPRGGKVACMLFKDVFLGQVKCVLIFEFVLFFGWWGSLVQKKFSVKRWAN